MSEPLPATGDENLARMNHEKALAFYRSGAAFWGEVLRAQLQIVQSMFTIGCALALGVRPKGLPASDAQRQAARAAAAVKPLHVTAVANAQRPGGRKRRTIRRP